jgi:RNA polymerase sigma-70 factor, ECF subfamily
MPSEADTLDALMARLAEGDRAVFSAVFQRLWGPIWRFSRSLLKNEADASEAAQEAMKKILERVSNYDTTRPALPWAMAIAAWECRTLARKRSRRRETDAPVPEAVSGEPEDMFVQRDLVSAATAALGELSDADRDVLVATYWDEATDVSGATLRKRRERALTRLRKTFWRLYGLD